MFFCSDCENTPPCDQLPQRGARKAGSNSPRSTWRRRRGCAGCRDSSAIRRWCMRPFSGQKESRRTPRDFQVRSHLSKHKTRLPTDSHNKSHLRRCNFEAPSTAMRCCNSSVILCLSCVTEMAKKASSKLEVSNNKNISSSLTVSVPTMSVALNGSFN